MNKHIIFIDGAAGTTGLRIRQRLSQQQDLSLLELPEEKRKDLDARLVAISKADFSILCLPDAASKEIAALAPPSAKLCDASTAHRTNPAWVYGLPELTGQRSAIQNATKVAVPGCHASGFVSLIAPLVSSGALHSGTSVHCHSITGYSGGGNQMINEYENEPLPLGHTSPRQYSLGMQHKHLPEMQALTGLASPPLFCPIVANYYSGMLVSIALPTAAFASDYKSVAAITALLQECYAGEALIKINPCATDPKNNSLAANALAGKDNMEIFISGSEQQVLLTARFCNLGKGASGAAVQCMNLMLGRPETAGLVF